MLDILTWLMYHINRVKKHHTKNGGNENDGFTI